LGLVDSDLGRYELVTAAGRGAYALLTNPMQALDQQPPGPRQVWLDARMPGISGLTVLDMLRAQGVDQPIVMLTGHGTVEMCRRAFKVGAAEFLEKPVNC